MRWLPRRRPVVRTETLEAIDVEPERHPRDSPGAGVSAILALDDDRRCRIELFEQRDHVTRSHPSDGGPRRLGSLRRRLCPSTRLEPQIYRHRTPGHDDVIDFGNLPPIAATRTPRLGGSW